MLNDQVTQLKAWVQRQLPTDDVDLRPMPAQLSFRSFFRVINGTQPLIVMHSPPPAVLNQSENQKLSVQVFDANRAFFDIAQWLRGIGLNAPQVVAHDFAEGYLLVSDLGRQLYFDAYQDSTHDMDQLFTDAIEALCVMQSSDHSKLDLATFDSARAQEELDRCAEWLVGEFLGDEMVEVFPNWSQACEVLVRNIAEQPQVFVHLDYHSQNLLVCDESVTDSSVARSNPGILDFQDALIGPVTYDIVSYLRDLYIVWPDDQRQRWLRQYWQLANSRGVPVGDDFEHFKRWFDLTGMQRQIKCFGNFTRGHFQQGKSRYLGYIPSTIEQVIDAAKHYPEFDGLIAWLNEDVLPRVIQKNKTILDQKACA